MKTNEKAYENESDCILDLIEDGFFTYRKDYEGRTRMAKRKSNGYSYIATIRMVDTLGYVADIKDMEWDNE